MHTIVWCLFSLVFLALTSSGLWDVARAAVRKYKAMSKARRMKAASVARAFAETRAQRGAVRIVDTTIADL